jgi:hypothetical protein
LGEDFHDTLNPVDRWVEVLGTIADRARYIEPKTHRHFGPSSIAVNL